MKKWHIVCITLLMEIIMCMVTGCASENTPEDSFVEIEEYPSGYDTDRKYNRVGVKFCETDTAYYGVLTGAPDYLHYMDKETGINGILCGKPECLHDNWLCNGYVMAGAKGLSIYDGKIYWVGNKPQEQWYDNSYYLWCMNLDGTNREAIQRIDGTIFTTLNTNITVQIHKGFVFISGESSSIINGELGVKVMVVAEKIGQPEERSVIFEEDCEGELWGCKTQLVGNRMYIMLNMRDSLGKYTLRIYSWDLNEKVIELMLEAKETSIKTGDMWVEPEKGIYLSENIGSEDDAPSVYLYDFESKEVVKCYDYETEDNRYTSVQLGENMSMTVARSENAYIMWVKTMEGETLYHNEIVLDGLFEERYARIFVGVDEEFVYYEYIEMMKEENASYMIRIPLSGGPGEILWQDTPNQKGNG